MVQYSREPFNGTFLYRATVSIPAARFFVTPSHRDLMVPLKTSYIARKYALAVCVNGGGFDYRDFMVISRGRAISRGVPYGRKLERTLYISKKNLISFVKGRGAQWNGIPYPDRLVSDGVMVNFPDTPLTPRTFLGIQGEECVFAVIEGIDGQSGANINQTAQLCIDLGFENAILFDSGYSSTLVVDGEVRNIPADGGIPGREAAVCTHFGVY